nr:uncharacterized protein LOC112765814 [Arachis hypogaea]
MASSAQEDPNQHLTTFLRICDTVKSNGVHPDAYRLLLFPFSLREKASKWLESFPKESLTTWEDVVNKFLARFYPPQRVNRLRAEVQTFRQQDGLSYESKKAIDHSSGGSLNKKKTIEEAIDVIEIVVDNEYFYTSERSNNRGVMELNNMDVILAQNKLIAKQLTDLTKKMEASQVAAIHTQSSAQEESNTEEEVVNYIENSARQEHDPYSKTYNPVQFDYNMNAQTKLNYVVEHLPGLNPTFPRYDQYFKEQSELEIDRVIRHEDTVERTMKNLDSRLS